MFYAIVRALYIFMNIEGYRKAKSKEPIIIDLNSDEQFTYCAPVRKGVKVEESLQFEQPNFVPLETTVVPAEPIADSSKNAEECIEMVVEYDESSNSYSYSYSCEMVQEEAPQQNK